MLDKDVYDSYFRIMNKKDKKLCDCTKGELLGVIKVIYSENQLLYKALDKACTRLESFDAMSYCPPEKHWSKEKWKEWCLKEE